MGLQPVKDVAADQNFRYLERLIRQTKVVEQVSDDATTINKTVIFRRGWVGNGLHWSGQRLSVLPAPDLGITVNVAGVAVKVKVGGGILIDNSGLYLDIIILTTVTEFHIVKDDATAVLHLKRNDTTIATNDIIGRIEVEGADADASGICATLEAIAEGNAGEAGWRFSTGVAGTVVERMRIKNTGRINLAALPIYANNAAAVAGGLVPGDLYRTGGNPDPVCIVHV